jgi:septal ring factor EnvC (AmiA/AmiB activator)
MILLNPQNVPPSFIPSRVVFVGVAGLSFCGLFAYFNLRKQQVQQARIEDEGKERRHLEELNFLRNSLSDSQAEVGVTKKSLTVCTEENERLKKRLAETKRDLDSMEKQNRTLEDQTRKLGTQNLKLEGELKNTKAEQRDTIELLRIRTAELKGAQAFLTKADILSGAEVIKLVEALNGEIMQTAAVMAEAFTIEEKRVEAKNGEAEEISKIYARAGEIVGYRMAEMLRTSEHHEDPILVQMGLQTAMVGYTHWVISSWCFESPEDERMLSEVYARVRETGKYFIYN